MLMFVVRVMMMLMMVMVTMMMLMIVMHITSHNSYFLMRGHLCYALVATNPN